MKVTCVCVDVVTDVEDVVALDAQRLLHHLC